VRYSIIASLWGNVISQVTSQRNALWAYLPGIGAIWFLLALFWCRIFFNYLYSVNEKKNLSIVLIAVIATLVCQYIHLPLSLLHGLSAMLFYYLGYLFKKHQFVEKKIPVYSLLIMSSIWIYCIVFSHLEMAFCEYKTYPIDILGAISGCYFTYILCKVINEKQFFFIHRIKSILLLLGNLSLVALCFHDLEMKIIPWGKIINKSLDIINIQSHPYLVAGLILFSRFILIGVFIYIIPKISFCQRVFSINKYN
jgi:hypothetical protein